MSSMMMPSPAVDPMPGTRSGPASGQHRRLALLMLAGLVGLSAPARCQEGGEWDRARAELAATQPGPMAGVVARWRALTASDSQGFDAYAGFLMAYPGFPDEMKLRGWAEKSPDLATTAPTRLVAFFDRFPPLTNPARAQYALALINLGRPEALAAARAAWRGGSMSDAAETALAARYGASFTQEDNDTRLDALLWDGNASQASRALARASASLRPVAMARLALIQGGEASGEESETTSAQEMARVTALANPGIAMPLPAPTPTLTQAPTSMPGAAPSADQAPTPDMLRDPGYLVDRARYLLRRNRNAEAAAMLATRPALTRPALDPLRWVTTLLAAARQADDANAAAIAASAADGFPAGTDVSQLAYRLRDRYTSLMWLGGTSALWALHDTSRASRLFYRYGTAARTPQTRAKGFYWAGRALEQAGDTPGAHAYYLSASAYPDEYYGLLALERLGLPIPSLRDPAHPQPGPAERAAFLARPLTQAVREVARDGDWQTTIRFFREIADQAKTESDFAMLADLAHSLGRRDLGVVAGQAAENAGFQSFRDLCFPLLPTPPGSDWTMVHAIARQESQLSQGAISRTGARGLMQLMPGTAADQARKLGLAYSTSALTDDASFNLTLGDAYFAHLMDVFQGSYPLAIAAYNSGPGNVGRWLRDIGDPRSGSIGWVEWIEHIPFAETRGYVQHVIENAVVYEAMNPAHARYRGSNPASHFLGKSTPG